MEGCRYTGVVCTGGDSTQGTVTFENGGRGWLIDRTGRGWRQCWDGRGRLGGLGPAEGEAGPCV